MSKITPGKYQHYKGPFYEVIGMCHHSETLEELVVYKSLYDDEEYGNEALWVRPLSMFMQTIQIEGQERPRFRKVDSN